MENTIVEDYIFLKDRNGKGTLLETLDENVENVEDSLKRLNEEKMYHYNQVSRIRVQEMKLLKDMEELK